MNKLEQAREALTRVAVSYDGFEDGDGNPCPDIAFAKETLAALALPVEGVKAEPRVKPLEWEREAPTQWHLETWKAQSLAGEYDIQREKDGRFSGFAPNAGTDLFGSLDAAKAAAQADYERRIKSALVGGCDD